MIQLTKKTLQQDNIDSMYQHTLDSDFFEFETMQEVHDYIRTEHTKDVSQQLLLNNLEPGMYEAQYDQSIYDYCEGVTSATMIIQLIITENGERLNL